MTETNNIIDMLQGYVVC